MVLDKTTDHIDKCFVLYGTIDQEGVSVMSCFFYSQEPQIKAGMQWPVIKGTRKCFPLYPDLV